MVYFKTILYTFHTLQYSNMLLCAADQTFSPVQKYIFVSYIECLQPGIIVHDSHSN